MEREALQEAIVCFGIGVAQVEIGDKRPGMGCRHSSSKSEIVRERTGGEQDIALSLPLHQYRRPSGPNGAAKRTGICGRRPFVGESRAEGMLGRFAPPPHLAHRRPLVQRQRIELGL
jgi:hypothetical protein